MKVELFFQSLQIEQQIFDNLVTLFAILAQSFRQDARQLRWSLRQIVSDRWWIEIQYCRKSIARCFALEWFPMGDHFIDDGPQTKNVGPRINRFPARLLGRHIAGRAEYHPRTG